eukprot:g18971.t1
MLPHAEGSTAGKQMRALKAHAQDSAQPYGHHSMTKRRMARFLCGLERAGRYLTLGLTHPEKSLPSELRSFREALVAQDAKGAKARWRRLWRKHVEVEVQEIAGTVHVDFGQRESSRKLGLQLGAELANGELVANKREAWMKFLQDMQQLPQTKQWANRKAPIEAFSPWLAKFDTRSAFGSHEEQLEVLGQYRGLERPEPRSHASVTRFGPQLLIMASKQMPKRLVILGSDEREHWFLVKGVQGQQLQQLKCLPKPIRPTQDVRLDERVEQLFGIINSMAPDAAGLRVRTYSVIPLFPDLGALEWVRETKPLKAIVQETARAKEMNEIEAHKLRIEWSKRFGGQAVQRYSKIFEALPGGFVFLLGWIFWPWPVGRF